MDYQEAFQEPRWRRVPECHWLVTPWPGSSPGEYRFFVRSGEFKIIRERIYHTERLAEFVNEVF